MGFFDFLTEEIAIDLGTANTLIIHNDKVVVDAPSIVARDRTTGKIIAVGREAALMQGKTHENRSEERRVGKEGRSRREVEKLQGRKMSEWTLVRDMRAVGYR